MTAQIRKGFTLIELLIVMAILGVLAVVVLVAINPVQQLARTRDAGRISSVQQVGHAIEAYAVTHNGGYPTVAQWTPVGTNVLAGTEVNAIPAQVTYSAGPTACTGNVINGTWCYAVNGTTPPSAFVLYAVMEANSNRTLGTCTVAGTSYIVYSSATGRACIACPAAEPTTAAPGTCVN